MTKLMLIDASHREETRVAVVDDQQLIDFDFEVSERQQVAGNIYLAKITRVEPSLQAAFVEYGAQRHGFLAFNEIHPDYYQIPLADREALKAEQAAQAREEGETEVAPNDGIEDVGGEDIVTPRPKQQRSKHYKIQEVIKRRQIILVQVVKEERGTKGAALTTYLSLPGRYCVLMPNTDSGGGISRKITNAADRKRLKTIASELNVPDGMGLIIRTAGAQRTKAEIKRDFEYLMRVWNKVREDTLNSIAPCLVYEEASLVKKSIRDLFSRDVENVWVQGETAYREAKDFMKMLTPSYARNVKQYKEPTPLFAAHGLEQQLSSLTKSEVQLPSGGYLVINSTEALVAVDVNSGRATKEHSIEETALKTNLEAATEVARQLKLRDLGGLVVIDFIDMDDNRHNRNVEKRLKDALKSDRARIQMGKISNFGLLEMSRQRLRPSMTEVAFTTCPICAGQGLIRNTESAALEIMRLLEAYLAMAKPHRVVIKTHPDLANFLANEKRSEFFGLENRYDVVLRLDIESHSLEENYIITLYSEEGLEIPLPSSHPSIGAEEEAHDKRRRRRRRKGKKDFEDAGDNEMNDDHSSTDTPPSDDNVTDKDDQDSHLDMQDDGQPGDDKPRRRRRGRRGGRRKKRIDNVILETPETLLEASSSTQDAIEIPIKNEQQQRDNNVAKLDSQEGDEISAAVDETNTEMSEEVVPHEAADIIGAPEVLLQEDALDKTEDPKQVDGEIEMAQPDQSQETVPSPTTPQAEDNVKPARQGWWKSRFGL